jgi:hypothetical protein
VPGYGAVSKAGWVISIPNAQQLVFSTGARVSLPDVANGVAYSDGGKWAWQAHASNAIYEALALVGPGYGQHSFLYVGETLRTFSDVATFHATSGGWAYVDEAGAIVSYGSVYSGPPLWERVDYHDLSIGQGPENEDGICVHVPGEAFIRQLTAGDYYHIRVSRTGDTFLILGVSYKQHATRVWSATLGELKALPRLSTAPPPVVTPPPPVVTPPPAPQPTPDAARAQAIVVQERKAFVDRSMHAADIVTLLKRVAARLNAEHFEGGPFGVLVKTGGTSCNGYSCDIICSGQGDAQRQWDVLTASDPDTGSQTPGWDGPLPQIAVRPCEIVTAPTPPTPPAPPTDDPRIAALERQVAALTEKLMAALADLADRQFHLDTLTTQLAAVTAERDAALATLAVDPCTRVRVRVVPGWLGSFAGTRCEAVR